MVLDQVEPNVIHGHIGEHVHVIITVYGPFWKKNRSNRGNELINLQYQVSKASGHVFVC